VTHMPRVSNRGKGTTMHNNNKGKGQRSISIIVHKVVQFLHRGYINLVLTKFVRFGHWGLGLADIVFDQQLLQ
jgi:hypothetical protein